MSALPLVLANAAAIRALAERYGARDVRLVGSVARGADGAESDVDLLVAFEPGHGLLDHARLVLALEDLLGRRVDVASEGGLKPAIRANLERDARWL